MRSRGESATERRQARDGEGPDSRRVAPRAIVSPGKAGRKPLAVPGIERYFDALRAVLYAESEVLARALPNSAERGRTNEERFRRFLAKVLPKKFSLGTGFVVSAERARPASPQIDIVVFDEVSNSPLGGDGEARVFPVESVYATIEVRTAFTARGFTKFLRQVAAIRELGRRKTYAVYAPVEKKIGKHIGVPRELPATLSPRCYLVCYDYPNARSFSKFVRSLEAELGGLDAHLHGVLVLNPGWFAYQEAYRAPPRLKAFASDALLHFTRHLLHDLSSFPMLPMAVDRYFQAGRT